MGRLKTISIVGLLALSLIGCAAEKKGGGSSAPGPGEDTVPEVDVPDGPYVPPGTGPGEGPGNNWEYGSTAELEVSSLSIMSEYTGRPMNNPQNIKINLNLVPIGNAYGGHVTISYTENGIPYQGYFTSGASEKETKYNIWFTKNNNMAWHGFFEDFLGGIVVVVDELIDLGDGGGLEDIAGGSVWFKNFEPTYAPHPPTRCWFVSVGPYDCRAWKDGDGIDTTRAVHPDSGYIKLGEFHGISLKKAFNTEELSE